MAKEALVLNEVDGHSLNIICRPARQALHFHLIFLFAWFWVFGRNWEKFLSGSNILTGIVGLLMLLALLAIMYRNLFHRESLTIYRDASQRGGDTLGLVCAELKSVYVRPAPNYFSYEAGMARFGLGSGPVVLCSADREHAFGQGLSSAEADLLARQIARFCRCSGTLAK